MPALDLIRPSVTAMRVIASVNDGFARELKLPSHIRSLGLKWFTEFGHLNRGDMLTSEQHRCHNEKKKFQRRV